MSIEEHYKNLINKYTDNKELTHSFWFELVKEYDSINRHYHNLSHIIELLQFFNQNQDKIGKKDVVLFAIFYHDIIYNIRGKNNEEKSAQVAKKRMSELNIKTEEISLCYNYIVSTKSHKAGIIDKDLSYFLDFDLAVLGKNWNSYKEYTEKIRKEYSIYPNTLYRKGRKKALVSILENNRIYKTEDFHKKFEQQARKNIRKELDEL